MIRTLTLKNFTVFRDETTLSFSGGLNVLVGENGTGKSHLLKLLTAGCNGCRDAVDATWITTPETPILLKFFSAVRDEFRVTKLERLVAHDQRQAKIEFLFEGLNTAPLSEIVMPPMKMSFTVDTTGLLSSIPSHDYSRVRAVMVPPKECLSWARGLVALFENREVDFEKAYPDLVRRLELPVSKQTHHRELAEKLIRLTGGRMERRADGVFVLREGDREIEAHQMAEGRRKFGVLQLLAANGTLHESVLLIDEPESNLNPRLQREMAAVLLEISKHTQVFIATHSLFLLRELHILKNAPGAPKPIRVGAPDDTGVRYFGLRAATEGAVAVRQGQAIEDIGDITALDENLRQADRYMNVEMGLAPDTQSEGA